MLEGITGKIENAFRRLRGRGLLSEKEIDGTLREVRIALLESDVHYKVAGELVGRVRERSLALNQQKAVTPAEQVLTVLQGELARAMGVGDPTFRSASPPPAVALLVGLQGSGKTTAAAKLAYRLLKENRRPLLAAADRSRPAAAEQLSQLAASIQVPVVTDRSSSLITAQEAIAQARREGRDPVLIDTAGRLSNQEALMRELAALAASLSPQEILLVVDATAGQDALRQARAFSEALPLTGLLLTKVDGDARGGALLSARFVTGLPMRFVGTGEALEDLEPFHADRWASRIAGRGDLASLAEKVERAAEKDAGARLADSVRQDSLTLDDYREQLRRLRGGKGTAELLSMIPGVSSPSPDQRARIQRETGRAEAIILSMTPAERKRPETIDGSRRKRISRGSGTSLADVNRLLRQFRASQKLLSEARSWKRGRFALGRRAEGRR